MGNKFPWPMGARAGGPLLGGGGGLPTLFDWNPELAEALPGTSTFARASIKQVLTTTDGSTFWYQQAKSGEVPLDGLRRVETVVPVAVYDGTRPWLKDASVAISYIGDGEWELTLTGSGSQQIFYVDTVSGSAGQVLLGSVELRRVSGTAETNFTIIPQIDGIGNQRVLTTVSSSFQRFATDEGPQAGDSQGFIFRIDTPDSTTRVYRFRNLMLERWQDGTTAAASALVRADTEYGNVGVDGVQYLATDNNNSIDGNGVVTEAAGTTITGGSFKPGPATTNRLLDSNDLTQGSWTASGTATPTDLGVTDIGGRTTQISGIGAEGVDDISQAAAGFTTSGAVAASLSLRRVSTTGILRIINTTGAANGEWQVDLSLVGADWVQLKDVGSTSPVVTGGAIESRVADSLTDTSWPAESSAVIDVTVAGVTIPGFSEVTPWVADGGGNAGMLFHAASGGPLTVDIAFNQLENSAGVEMRMLGFGDNTAYSFRLDLPTVARIATGGINSFFVAASSYESERHGFGMSFQVNEGIVVDDEDNDNTDVTGTPGGGTIQIGLNSGLVGVPGNYHRIRIYDEPQTVEELKALV